MLPDSLKSRFSYVRVLVLTLLLAAPVWAEPAITAGTHTLLPNTAGQTVEIYVTGGDLVAGLNLYLQVGDGTDGPVITGIDILNGTIFDGTFNLGQFGLGNDVGTDPWKADQGTALLSGDTPASGLLASVTLDTTGLTEGSWVFILDPPSLGTTDFAGTQAVLENGALTIPEPASFGLIVFALAAFGLHRRAMI